MVLFFFFFTVHGVMIAFDGRREASIGDFPVAEFYCSMGLVLRDSWSYTRVYGGCLYMHTYIHS